MGHSGEGGRLTASGVSTFEVVNVIAICGLVLLANVATSMLYPSDAGRTSGQVISAGVTPAEFATPATVVNTPPAAISPTSRRMRWSC
jgi:hypothetical protein